MAKRERSGCFVFCKAPRELVGNLTKGFGSPIKIGSKFQLSVRNVRERKFNNEYLRSYQVPKRQSRQTHGRAHFLAFWSATKMPCLRIMGIRPRTTNVEYSFSLESPSSKSSDVST